MNDTQEKNFGESCCLRYGYWKVLLHCRGRAGHGHGHGNFRLTVSRRLVMGNGMDGVGWLICILAFLCIRD